MTITNYTTLQSTMGDFLNRSDLTSVLPVFVQMCEARINRELRHWQMETNTTYTADARYEDLPTGWLETIRLDVSGGDRLTLLSHGEMAALRASNDDTAGEPSYYAFVAGQIELYPTPGSAYTINHAYFAEIPDLATNTTNWLLTAAPDVYLYGSLIHAAPYLVEDQRLPVWEAMYMQAMTALQAASKQARHSGTSLKVATRRVS